MDKFTLYLTNNGRSEAETKKRVNVIKRLNNIMNDNKKEYDDFEFLIQDKERIRKWMLENLATSSCSFYSISVRKAIDSMSIAQSKKDAAIRFYLDIAAESQRVTNRKAGRVTREYVPKRAIEEISELFAQRPKVIIDTQSLPKIQKVEKAMPHVQESSAPIEEQIKAYLETATTGKGTPLSKTSKYMYRENMKTMMNRMNKINLDFIVSEVPNVIDFFDRVDNSETGPQKYLARMRARNFYTAVVAVLPIAKAQDMNERIVVKDQYNQWLKAHPIIKTPGKVKDYGGTWESIVREISDKVQGYTTTAIS